MWQTGAALTSVTLNDVQLRVAATQLTNSLTASDSDELKLKYKKKKIKPKATFPTEEWQADSLVSLLSPASWKAQQRVRECAWVCGCVSTDPAAAGADCVCAQRHWRTEPSRAELQSHRKCDEFVYKIKAPLSKQKQSTSVWAVRRFITLVDWVLMYLFDRRVFWW